MRDLGETGLRAEKSMRQRVGEAVVTPGERRAFLAGFLFGLRTAPLPDSVAEALNSGDGSYRP